MGFEIACVTFGLLAATSITITALLDENGEFNLGLKGLLIAMPGFLVWLLPSQSLLKFP